MDSFVPRGRASLVGAFLACVAVACVTPGKDECEIAMEYKLILCPKELHTAHVTSTSREAEQTANDLSEDGWQLLESHWSMQLHEVILVFGRARR